LGSEEGGGEVGGEGEMQKGKVNKGRGEVKIKPISNQFNSLGGV